MPRVVIPTTVSLTKSIAADLKRLSRAEGRSASELVREAIRQYRGVQENRRRVSWDLLRKRLKRISQAGKKADLGSFVSSDRRRD